MSNNMKLGRKTENNISREDEELYEVLKKALYDRDIHKVPLNESLRKNRLKIINLRSKVFSLEDAVKDVEDNIGYKIIRPSSERQYLYPRMVISYHVRKNKLASLYTVRDYFGYRNHATIINHERTTEDLYHTKDPDFMYYYDRVTKLFKETYKDFIEYI